MTLTLRKLLLITVLIAGLSAGLWAGSSQAAILELSGPAGASVTINGLERGYFPLEHPLDLGPGTYLVECSLPGYKDYQWSIFLADEADWKRLHVRMTRLSRKTAVFSNILFAGLGQHYLDKSARGYFYNLAEAGGLITALLGEAGRANYRNDYLLLKDKYDSAFGANELAYYKEQTEKAYQDMEDMTELRDTGLMVAGGAIVLSMLDALIFFPSFDAGPGPGPDAAVDPDSSDLMGMSPSATDYFTTVHAGIKLKF